MCVCVRENIDSDKDLVCVCVCVQGERKRERELSPCMSLSPLVAPHHWRPSTHEIYICLAFFSVPLPLLDTCTQKVTTFNVITRDS